MLDVIECGHDILAVGVYKRQRAALTADRDGELVVIKMANLKTDNVSLSTEL